MSFTDDLNKFKQTYNTRTSDIFAATVMEVHNSIQNGSAITGAPGQPVDTGKLRASWQVWFLSPTEAFIGTDTPYAHSVEDGLSYAHKAKPIHFHSMIGGAHSLKLTIAGFQRIVDYVTRKVKGQ